MATAGRFCSRSHPTCPPHMVRAGRPLPIGRELRVSGGACGAMLSHQGELREGNVGAFGGWGGGGWSERRCRSSVQASGVMRRLGAEASSSAAASAAATVASSYGNSSGCANRWIRQARCRRRMSQPDWRWTTPPLPLVCWWGKGGPPRRCRRSTLPPARKQPQTHRYGLTFLSWALVASSLLLRCLGGFHRSEIS